MSTYLVVSTLPATSSVKSHDEIVASICRTGFFSPVHKSYQVHGVFPYWTQAKACAQTFAKTIGTPVEIVTLFLDGGHMVSDKVEPPPVADPLTIEDLVLDPYDGVPADTNSV